MLHDKMGVPLQVGDIVYLPCKVLRLEDPQALCNVTLEPIEPCVPGEAKQPISCNVRQLIKSVDGRAPWEQGLVGK